MRNKNDKQELIKLLQENPELPVVFGISNNEVAYDYGSTVCNEFYCYVGEVYKMTINEEYVIFDDYEYVLEEYMDYLCDTDECKAMNDEEYEQYIKDYIEKNVKHYRAIIVDCLN